MIDPGPREIKGRRVKGKDYQFDNGTFGPLPYTVVSLASLAELGSSPSTADRISAAAPATLIRSIRILATIPARRSLNFGKNIPGR